MELDAISQPELEQIERVGSADLVVGILDGMRQEGRQRRGDDDARSSGGIIQAPAGHGGLNNGSHTGTGPAAAPDGDSGTATSPACLSCSLPLPGPAETPQQSISNAYRRVFAVGGKLGARACGVIASTSADCDSPMDLPAGPAGAGSGVRSGRALLYAPEDGGSPQPERPLSAAPGALRRTASKSHGSRFRTLGKASAAGSPAGFRSAERDSSAIPWPRSPPLPRAAAFRFANRTWASAPSAPPTGGI